MLERRLLLSRATAVDVSQYQGTINWTSVASSVNYAYIRATYGESSVDPDFTANAAAAANAGMTIGFYHFAYYNLAGHTPALEASNFWNEVKTYYKANGKYLMPMLDVEEGSALGTGTGVSTLSQWVEDWCSDIISDAASIGLHVVPLIYTSSSFAGSYFDSTPPESIPLWVADYTGTTTPQTSQPTAGTGVWQTWQMWQYSSSGSVSGITGDVDEDVLNGDTTTLKDYIVSSTTGTISAKYAINTTIQTTTSVNAYATLADAQNQTSNFTVVASGSVGTILSAPAYGGSYQRYKVTFKNGVTGYVAEDFMATAAAPAAVTLSSPANNAHLTAQPGSLTWTASTLATSYGVYLNGTLKTTTTAASYSLGTLGDGTYTWQVKAINSQGTAAGSTDTFILDTTPPTATLPTQAPTGGSSTFQFTVTYADATSGVNSGTIGGGNITVTGPNSFSQAASFVSYNSGTGVATYQITAPGGTWTAADNGTYTVLQNASSVKDNFGNARPAGAIGTFIANVFAYLSGTTLVVDYGSTSGSLSLSPSGQNLIVEQGSNSDTFSGASVTAITVTGSASGDTFSFSGPVTQPVELDLGGGNGTVDVNAGTMSVSNDVTNASPGLTLNVASGATANFTTDEGLANLTINGGAASLTSPSLTTLTITDQLSIINGGTLDVGLGQLMLNSTNNPVSSILPLIQSGYANGQWNGQGLITSAGGTGSPFALGYADGADGVVAGLPAGEVLVKATYYGDANLDGTVDINDLDIVLSNYTSGKPVAWDSGDFNYDGVTDISDLNEVLSNYGKTVPAIAPPAQAPASEASVASAHTPANAPTNVGLPAASIAPTVAISSPSVGTSASVATASTALNLSDSSTTPSPAAAPVMPSDTEKDQAAPLSQPTISTEPVVAATEQVTTQEVTTTTTPHHHRLSPLRRIARLRRAQQDAK